MAATDGRALVLFALACGACVREYRISVESAVQLQRLPASGRRGAFVAAQPLEVPRRTYVRANLILHDLRELGGRPVARVYKRVANLGAILFGAGMFTTAVGVSDLFTAFPDHYPGFSIVAILDLSVGTALYLAGAATWIAGATMHPGEVPSPPDDARILGPRW